MSAGMCKTKGKIVVKKRKGIDKQFRRIESCKIDFVETSKLGLK